MTKRVETPYAIKIMNLSKQFKEFIAVDKLSMTIYPGEIYGLLGSNGAGKTTVIKMLSTILSIDSGKATIFGYDVNTEAKEVRQLISLTGQYATIDEELTGIENLEIIARLQGLSKKEAQKRADELLSLFQLTEAASKQAKTYSGGMKRRLDIASSIVVQPKLLFLDEPSTGLDPRSRNQVWNIIRQLTKKGATILLTTQYLEEAEQLANRIGIMDKGKILVEGTPDELKNLTGVGQLHIQLDSTESIGKLFKEVENKYPNVLLKEKENNGLVITIKDDINPVNILYFAKQLEFNVISFSLEKPSLEDVFLSTTE